MVLSLALNELFSCLSHVDFRVCLKDSSPALNRDLTGTSWMSQPQSQMIKTTGAPSHPYCGTGPGMCGQYNVKGPLCPQSLTPKSQVTWNFYQQDSLLKALLGRHVLILERLTFEQLSVVSITSRKKKAVYNQK